MRIAYIYDLPADVTKEWECKKRFIDMPSMRRTHRTDLIDGRGLRPGDTLVICKLSQLGQGRESQRIQKRLKEMRVNVEVIPLPVPVKLKARTGHLIPTPEQMSKFCPLWLSTQPPSAVIEQASEEMETSVNRSWMNRHCGLRN